MSFTRRLGSGRGRLSLRSRLLAGLITVTALFLIVMGVVTTVVLGHSEQGQFNTDLLLTAKSTPKEIANAASGYVAANVSARTGQVTILTPQSRNASDLQEWLAGLIGQGGAYAFLKSNDGQVFDVALPDGGSAVAATVRVVDLDALQSSETGGLLPAGRSVIVVARPLSAVGSEVRGLVLAELITGAILLALLAVGGRWLISRGLAPLDRMASTADMITSRGDLTARMPDPGDHAEAGRLAGAINTMLDRIQQAFRARWESEQKVRQFAADASHELRTPLTTIRGYAELYRQGALGPDRLPNAMRRIEQEADRMSSLVAELLELARLDRDSSLDLTETDLSALVADAVADAQAVEPSRPVNARTPPSLVVVADEPRIRQVLANLLGNVRQHTAPDTPVAVRLSRAGQGALLEVTDAGQGMDAEAAARAFDRFYRGGHDGKDAHGSGLGLSIVQAIAAAHGGHAMLKSAPRVGTSVQVWIPFHPPAQDSERMQVPGAAYN
ncbi:MAG: sensor histidine kinase [Streptosporangiaceae bacterium]